MCICVFLLENYVAMAVCCIQFQLCRHTVFEDNLYPFWQTLSYCYITLEPFHVPLAYALQKITCCIIIFR